MCNLAFRAKETPQLLYIIDAGCNYCQANYIVEGNYPLIFTAHMVLCQLDSSCQNIISIDSFHLTLKYAFKIMEDVRKNLGGVVQKIQQSVSTKQVHHKAKQQKLENFLQRIEYNQGNHLCLKRIINYVPLIMGGGV